MKGSKEGKQYVKNMTKAQKAEKNATEDAAADSDEGEESSNPGNSETRNEEKLADANSGEDDSSDGSQGEQKQLPKNTPRGQKRGRPTKPETSKEAESKKQKVKSGNSSSKTKKNISSSMRDHTEAPPAGSRDRLPQEGQDIHWTSLGRFSTRWSRFCVRRRKCRGRK